jgi:uncharacterized membrane protein YraQ (UPF0718 family)
MGKPGLKSIIKAALFGVPLPLCSCGVIPVTASLKKQGAGRGAAGSFLISTPQTGLDSFFATYSMLGWVFAIIRPVTAFITGILGGFLMEKLDTSKTKEEKALENSSEEAETEEKPKPKGLEAVAAVFHYGFIKLLGDISSALMVGLVLAALIHFGIPLYVCSTASVPIALSLIVKGISPGAALVFLVTGPATNIATIATMAKVLGKKSVVIYIFSVMVGAIIAGVILNMFDLNLSLVNTMRSGGKMQISFIEHVSAVILLLLIALAIFKGFFKKSTGKTETQPEKSCCSSCCNGH